MTRHIDLYFLKSLADRYSYKQIGAMLKCSASKVRTECVKHKINKIDRRTFEEIEWW